MSATELSPTRLIAPRLALSSCVRAMIVRSTVEAPLADPAARFNHFPATPHCSISWFVEGDADVVEPAGLPKEECRAVFVGPQTRPMTTWNPGPVRIFMILFYPQALHALTGVDVPAWVDRWAGVGQVLGPEWEALSDAMLAAPDDGARVALLEAFLGPRWQAARPGAAGAASAGDWVRHLAWQVAGSALGRGVRSIERHVKARAGQPMRKLLRFQRAEQSFFDARDAFLAGRVTWADVAARGGYADQAHLCREAREITGHSPHALALALKSDDEPYWIYRIWV